ncbi:aminoglycoside phosphotransferase family protein [Ornithinimicrobium sediminis]|uniref:aminoglycoside phosphotransferase family protein n=1 Tax=Ornithinimicrobium sediminis TaxID=2904603 RepID=UPI001E4B4B23|nr:aminoglycoside phosphotransferase family protein [Ornithinimicrobium sediminis]
MTRWDGTTLPQEVVDRFRSLPPDSPDGPSGDAWLSGLPVQVDELLDRWRLRVEGPARHGVAALVLPTLREDGSRAALKLSWPHREAAYEHLALRAWDGRSAVRLLAADPARWALLLEWLDPDHDLDRLDDVSACRVVGSLLRALDRPRLPQMDTLSAHLAALVDDIDRVRATGRGGPLPRRLLDQGRAMALGLADHPAVDARLVHTDLHGQNVLRRPGTGAWVAIDPKPLSALPEIGVAPVLWNRWYEVAGSDDPRGVLRRRVETVCEHGGLDPDLARVCSIVRMVRTALWAAGTPGRHTDEVTVAVTVAKALLPD